MADQPSPPRKLKENGVSIAVCCFLANQEDFGFPLKTVLQSYLEADEVYLYAGDAFTEGAWASAVRALMSPNHVRLISSNFEIRKPQDICSAKNSCIDRTVPQTMCDRILVVDPDVALVPGWTGLLSSFCAGWPNENPFRIYIQNAMAFIDADLMPFGTTLMARNHSGRLVWDGSYFSPDDLAAPHFPVAVHLGYMTLTMARHHFSRTVHVWADHIGPGGVDLFRKYMKMGDRELAENILIDLRDGRHPSLGVLTLVEAKRKLSLVTGIRPIPPGPDLAPWIGELIRDIGAEGEMEIVRSVLDVLK